MPALPEKQQLYEAIEACRPGSEDLNDLGLVFLAEAMANDPALAARYQWAQAVDRQIASAFAEVPVPEGLEARILERLQDADLPPEESEAPTQATLGSARPRGRRKARRWLLVSGLCAAAAAAGWLVAFWPSDPGPILSTFQVQEEALRFALGESEEVFGSGEDWPSEWASGAFPVSRAIWVRGAVRVRKIQGLLGREGAAYDLTGSEGTQATLYVVPVRQGGAVRVEETVPAEPPRYEQTARTGGCCAGAWQEDGLLYMLVVRRDSRRAYYQFFLPQLITQWQSRDIPNERLSS